MKGKIFFSGLTALTLAALILGSAVATDGNLPGGTSISVAITSPSNGALISSTPGDVTLEGTASVGKGVPLPETLIVYVLDVSYSTIRGDGGTGCGGDQNGDGIANTILDCEIAAAKSLNSEAITLGTVGDVGVAVLGGQTEHNSLDTGGATADLGPAVGIQALTGPSTDAGGAPGPDVEEVLSSAFSKNDATGGVEKFTLENVGSNATNFSAGLSAAFNDVNASTKPNKIIVFMSDGLANTGVNVSTLSVPAGVVIYTFAVGTVSSCTDDPNGLGSLADIASMGATGSTCTNVSTVANLPDVIPAVIASQLTGLQLSVDGGAPVDITSSATPALPQAGPASVTFSYSVTGLAPGSHHLCVTALGSDAGGAGQVENCIDVTVAEISLAPATATNELGTPGQTHTVTATLSAGSTLMVSGVPIDFSIISGPNMGMTGTGTTDSNGQATFTYTATQGIAGLGTDKIQACFTDDLNVKTCADAEKIWQDTTPPVVTVSVTPEILWPPNHKYRNVVVTLVAKDAVDPNPTVELVSAVSSEPDNGLGDGDMNNDIVTQGLYDFKMRAERSGLGDGRTYTITYKVTDFSGNSTIATVTVFVPHDMGQAIAMGHNPIIIALENGDPMVFIPIVKH
jgi:hypothetical protein